MKRREAQKALKNLLKCFGDVVQDANTYSFVEGLRQRGFTREYAAELEKKFKKRGEAK